MPLNVKGKKILAAMQKEYGKEKGKAHKSWNKHNRSERNYRGQGR